ncbi:hypothetical protein DI43_16130 [Geobacillus sp. CAMR12739]|nr:hypothetical protein DI43_16130 [Geobacillus sp. CAMR12739]
MSITGVFIRINERHSATFFTKSPWNEERLLEKLQEWILCRVERLTRQTLTGACLKKGFPIIAMLKMNRILYKGHRRSSEAVCPLYRAQRHSPPSR